MANKHVHFRDGGKSDEEGLSRLLGKIAGTNNAGRVGTNDFKVKQQAGGTMNVLVTEGDFVIPYLDYFYHAWIDDDEVVAIDTADASFGRIDRFVAYIDRDVVSSSTTNNLDALKFKNVTGAATGSPTARTDNEVQTSVGAGFPWKELAQIAVGAGVGSITDANITDKRAQFIVGGGVGGATLAVLGTLIVANDLTPYWISPKAGTFTTLSARVKTAPTGQALQVRINKNGTQAATLSVSAGSNSATSSISVSFSQGDYFSLDITQVGSTVNGADLTVTLG